MEPTRINEDCDKTRSHETCCDTRSSGSFGVRQTLSEMDFERGIWYAAQNNDTGRIEDLLRKGVSPNVEDVAGYTALHYAARAGHLEVCKVLTRNGGRVNAVTRCGNATALHRSAMRGVAHVVDYLLSHGCDANIRDSDGYTALHRAVLADSTAVCQLLVPVTDLTLRDNKSRTPYQLARERDSRDLIRLFEESERTMR